LLFGIVKRKSGERAFADPVEMLMEMNAILARFLLRGLFEFLIDGSADRVNVLIGQVNVSKLANPY
jgi:hypothetical protein